MVKVSIKIMKECTSPDPVNITLKVIGGKWKPVILWYLKDETKRFNTLYKEISGITQKMLIQELRELESDGIIKRKVLPVIPPHVEYSITKYGKTIEPILISMAEWGNFHIKKNHKS
jgi:DNA-binding HxlR family transcriptional regulator